MQQNRKIYSLCGLALLLFAPLATANHFEIPDHPWVKRHLNFWIRIYTDVSDKQGLLHDSLYVGKIFEVMNLPPGEPSQKRVQKAKEHWRKILLSVHRKQRNPEKMTEEEKRVYQMYSDVDSPNRFLEARQKKRIRFQRGLKEKMKKALIASGALLPAMEKIFLKAGIPTELTRLPFVESSFNLKAKSKVGASGIWQFLRSTGKRYLLITPAIDERNDPLLATEAAAKLLQENYQALGSWPLAVAAYNHGRKGMMRAVRRMGTQEFIGILEGYSHPTFGFASRNFLMEFLAAMDVEKNAAHYFGDLKRDPPWEVVEVLLADPPPMSTLAKGIGVSEKILKRWNPALSSETWKGRLLPPPNLRLRLPPDLSAQEFWSRYTRLGSRQ